MLKQNNCIGLKLYTIQTPHPPWLSYNDIVLDINVKQKISKKNRILDMNQNKQLIILENFSVLSEDCIQSSPAWRRQFGVFEFGVRSKCTNDIVDTSERPISKIVTQQSQGEILRNDKCWN